MEIRTTTGVEVVLTAFATLDADQQDETLVRLLALRDSGRL